MPAMRLPSAAFAICPFIAVAPVELFSSSVPLVASGQSVALVPILRLSETRRSAGFVVPTSLIDQATFQFLPPSMRVAAKPVTAGGTTSLMNLVRIAPSQRRLFEASRTHTV